MRRYETIYIMDPDLSEEKRTEVSDRIEELVKQQGGFLAEMDKWGARKLAYEIKKKERGYYVRLDLCGTGELVNEIERFFRIDDRVLKYMTILLDKEVDVEGLKQEIAQAKAEQEAAAEKAKAAEEQRAAAAAAEEATEAESVDEETPPPTEEAADASTETETSETVAETTETPNEQKQEERRFQICSPVHDAYEPRPAPMLTAA